MLKKNIYVRQAPEPSNVVWKNMHVTPQTQLKWKLIAFFGIFILLLGAFVALYYLENISTVTNQKKYPASVNCDPYSEIFADDPNGYKHWAEQDAEQIDQYTSTGLYQCYCSMQGISAITDELCGKFFKDLAFGLFITISISLAIVIINTLFSMICFFLISKIGYHKESKIA